MKTLIAGSRSITDKVLFDSIMEKYVSPISQVVCGMARGVDMLGYHWATQRGIPVKSFPADWQRFGRRAGMVRNIEMAEYVDAAIVIWDGSSSGTKHMLNTIIKLGKPLWLVRTDDDDG